MDEHQICNLCNGNKKYKPLGHMEIDCALCSGKGFTIKQVELHPPLNKYQRKKKKHPLNIIKRQVNESINKVNIT